MGNARCNVSLKAISEEQRALVSVRASFHAVLCKKRELFAPRKSNTMGMAETSVAITACRRTLGSMTVGKMSAERPRAAVAMVTLVPMTFPTARSGASRADAIAAVSISSGSSPAKRTPQDKCTDAKRAGKIARPIQKPVRSNQEETSSDGEPAHIGDQCLNGSVASNDATDDILLPTFEVEMRANDGGNSHA